jgi:hypothetical protein
LSSRLNAARSPSGIVIRTRSSSITYDVCVGAPMNTTSALPSGSNVTDSNNV